MSEKHITTVQDGTACANHGLLLGRAIVQGGRTPIGFGRQHDENVTKHGAFVTYAGDGHAITFAPTGAGKGVGPVICNALNHPGQLIAFDPKGELFESTARARRRYGPVYRLDLRDDGTPSDSVNPVDLMGRCGTDTGALARSAAAELVERTNTERDRFWGDWAETLITGGLAWQMTDFAPGDQRISRIFDLLTGENATYSIESLLDSGACQNRVARTAFTSFLQLPERETRPCVQASVLQHLRLFDSDLVRRLTDTTSIDLDALVEGHPMTIYITVPPTRMSGFRPLLRCWLTGFLNALTQRESLPEHKTLILCDEAAMLGRSEALLTASTLLRGWGVQVWSFWQSPAQLEIYGADARTIVDNAGVVQCFGPRNMRAAKEFADLVGGIDAETVMALGSDEQIVLIEGGHPQRMQRMRHYEEACFVGRYDNPRLFRPHPAAPVVPARR